MHDFRHNILSQNIFSAVTVCWEAKEKDVPQCICSIFETQTIFPCLIWQDMADADFCLNFAKNNLCISLSVE